MRLRVHVRVSRRWKEHLATFLSASAGMFGGEAAAHVLTQSMQNELACCLELVKVQAGTRIVTAGDCADATFFVMIGVVEVKHSSASSTKQRHRCRALNVYTQWCSVLSTLADASATATAAAAAICFLFCLFLLCVHCPSWGEDCVHCLRGNQLLLIGMLRAAFAQLFVLINFNNKIVFPR